MRQVFAEGTLLRTGPTNHESKMITRQAASIPIHKVGL